MIIHDDPLAKRFVGALVQCYVQAWLANKQYYGKIPGVQAMITLHNKCPKAEFVAY